MALENPLTSKNDFYFASINALPSKQIMGKLQAYQLQASSVFIKKFSHLIYKRR